ncbi:hypothetical protein MTO96_019100 [Rhipicephalus appendiculatus]
MGSNQRRVARRRPQGCAAQARTSQRPRYAKDTECRARQRKTKPARVKEGQRGHRAPDGNEVCPSALSPISIPTARPTTCVRVAAAHYSNRAHSKGATAKEVPASAAGVQRLGAMQRCAKQSDPTRLTGVHHAPPRTLQPGALSVIYAPAAPKVFGPCTPKTAIR